VIEAFAQRYDIKVEAKVTAVENIAFNVPRQLRPVEVAVAP
jgi:4-hydroxy-3-methylbut-2-enyl diphosphate reductase